MRDLIVFTGFIALFLAGMYVLRLGLFHAAGKGLKKFLGMVTNKTWKSFTAGILFTGILQSSSAVMVMAVGLVAAKIMTFPQTIGIILGTNIGSTFLTEFIAFPMERWIIPGLAIGLLLLLIPRSGTRGFGTALIGMSALFTAMLGFKTLAGPIAGYPAAVRLLTFMDEHAAAALLAGIIVTAVIHSSSAVVGMAMGFAAAGDLHSGAAIAVMLGSNIGTCITGYLASFGSGREAALTAYAHIWLNLLGVLVFLPFISVLEKAVTAITSDQAQQLAHAGLIFNTAVSLAVLPFARQFAEFIIKIHGQR